MACGRGLIIKEGMVVTIVQMVCFRSSVAKGEESEDGNWGTEFIEDFPPQNEKNQYIFEPEDTDRRRN